MTQFKAGVPAVGSTMSMTPKMLSDYDDIGTAVIVDPYLGFSTHKMNLRFRSPSVAHQKYLKEVVKKFIEHQDYEKAYNELLGCEWLKSITRRKKKEWQNGLKEHVSFIFTKKIRHCTVWKLQKFSLTPFSKKFRESNGFTKKLLYS